MHTLKNYNTTDINIAAAWVLNHPTIHIDEYSGIVMAGRDMHSMCEIDVTNMEHSDVIDLLRMMRGKNITIHIDNLGYTDLLGEHYRINLQSVYHTLFDALAFLYERDIDKLQDNVYFI